MTTLLHTLIRGHNEAEVWADGHPSVFAKWCTENKLSPSLNPTSPHSVFSGITTNPKLLVQAIETHPELQDVAQQVVAGSRDVEHIALQLRAHALRIAADMLSFRYHESGGQHGWVSAQVNPHLADDTDAMVHEGEELANLADNIMVKLPATQAGILALEILSARGVSTNTTLLTTVSQTQAALSAIYRGEARRTSKRPWRAVITFMVGRLGEALHRSHPTEINIQDARRIELLALEQQQQLFQKGEGRVKLLVCSLRANHVDLELGLSSAHLAAVYRQPCVLTCPISFLESTAELSSLPAPLVVSEEERERLCRLPVVQRAIKPDGLPAASFAEWPALVHNREQHAKAHSQLLHLSQRLLGTH